jgi:uncharacterized protein YdeI (YjbR/CyaY-like superfamily)
MPEPKNIKFFKTTIALRKWLEKNHSKKDELWMGYHKKSSGKPGVTYKQALDEMLCFGWIDGIAKGIDDEKYCQRYTPRRAKSIWSAVNIKKIEELTKAGLMHEVGFAAFNNRDHTRTGLYSGEQKEIKFPAAFLKMLKANKKAWEYFSKMPPGYRKNATWWVISAKQEETKLRRMKTLIADSEAGRKIGPLMTAKEKAKKN